MELSLIYYYYIDFRILFVSYFVSFYVLELTLSLASELLSLHVNKQELN
jgi:hypothetical protein